MHRTRGLRLLIALLLAAAAVGVDPGHVSAQVGDVTVDPQSPAGTEYDIPLMGLRRIAAPDPSKNGIDAASTADVPPAFGAGVDSGPGSRGDRASSRDTATDREGLTSGNPKRALAALTSPADEPVPVHLITGGIALLVLLFAGAVRLARRSPG